MNSSLPYIVLDYVVSAKLYSYFETIVNLWLMLFLSVFGLVTNTLNTVIFVRQGFKDSVTISMMVIAVWDLIKCTTGLIHRVYGPLYAVSPLVSYWWQTLTLFVDYTPIFTGYVNYSLTAYVSVERCMCVSRPFTVKSIFTRRFTIFMVTTISLVIFGAFFVIYFIYDIYYIYVAEFKLTLPFFYYSRFYYQNQVFIMTYYDTLAILLPFLSFIVLCFSSSITMYYLKKSTQFTTKIKNTLNVTQREQKVSKMLLIVILVKICNLFPRIVNYLIQLCEPEYYALRHYHYLFMTVTRFFYVLDFINAGVMFFIYHKMSSKFKSTFSQLFHAR